MKVLHAPDTGAPDTGGADTGTMDTGVADTGTSDTAAADTGPPPCPDPTGLYTLTAMGNCGDLSTMAAQRIMLTATMCSFEFISGVPTGPEALNGSFLLDASGTFSNVTLRVGFHVANGMLGDLDRGHLHHGGAVRRLHP